MSESRVALACSMVSLVLLLWISVSRTIEPVTAPMPAGLGANDLQRLREEVRLVHERLEALGAPMARGHVPAETLVSEPRERVAIQPENDVVTELRSLRLAVQALDDALRNAPGGHPSHNLDEIRRLHPTTNWSAFHALVHRIGTEPGYAPTRCICSDDSAALREFVMLRPLHVLERLGAPAVTAMVQGGFVWTYHSPDRGADREPVVSIEIAFEQGYVRHAELVRASAR